MSETANPTIGDNLEARLFRFLSGRRLALYLALLSLVLTSPALVSGYRLDDYIATYIYGDDASGKHAFEVWSGGYGIARGDAKENHWLVEQGWAPWWIKDDLLIRLFRPLGIFSHHLDAALWPHTAWLAHLHSLLWMVLLVLAMTRAYRSAMGPLVGGMAALLFAIDHTHGFTVGYICNRHALISGLCAATCLAEHIRYREHGELRGAFLGPLWLALGLLASESTVAIAGYLVAYAAFADRGSLWRRGLSLVPSMTVVVLWRGLYNAAGYGARGSGMYLDPGLDPMAFVGALLQRGPVLLLGQYLAPPAETFVLVGPDGVPWLVAGACVFVLLLCVGLIPLLRRDGQARFWAAGSLLSMVPAASAYPHNRQLLLVSFGAMALIAKLWHLHAVTLKGKPHSPLLALSGSVGAVVLVAHLVVSPIALPLTSFSPAFTAPLHHAIDDVGDEIAGRDAVFVTAPDYFAVKLIQLDRRNKQQPLPRHFRALSFGPEQVTVHRADARTLSLDIQGGILTDPLLELYRDHRIPIPVGHVMDLEGLSIDVQHVTEAGMPDRVRFTFDKNLEDDSLCFYYWKKGGGFARLSLPSIGQHLVLPPATFPWGL